MEAKGWVIHMMLSKVALTESSGSLSDTIGKNLPNLEITQSLHSSSSHTNYHN